jgi:tetratricopeptide (TPR) repeat protein
MSGRAVDETDAKVTDPDHAAGRLALERRDWRGARDHLRKAALRDSGNADLQNLLGFAHRQLGLYPEAFTHYERALALDPRHLGAHEYIGETYLKVGNLPAAEKHLSTLRQLCPLSCEPLEDLERAVAQYRKTR